MPNTMTLLDPVALAADGGPLRLVLTARLRPVGGLDRFQPAGFPEIGHVIYDAPREGASSEKVCIVDSPASMANHLEWVCLRSRWDLDLAEELTGVPYLRCVTGDQVTKNAMRVVATSLTEGHRIASTYFLGERAKGKWNGKSAQRIKWSSNNDNGILHPVSFGDELAEEFQIVHDGKPQAHPRPDAWWSVFSAIFKYDPNSLLHGVMFPQWQVKIPRVLTAHLEAFGASRIDSSGVKFDRLGKTTSGQPIFSKDEETAREIRATFILDLALLRSFGRGEKGKPGQKGLHQKQKEFLAAFALWKIGRLLNGPFRYRTGCDLECERVVEGIDGRDDLKSELAKIEIKRFVEAADFPEAPITDIYWPPEELYRPGKGGDGSAADDDQPGENDGDKEEEE